jgi:predicted AAA+ superfamily ATPase
LGTALENLIYHELSVYNLTQNRNRPIFFYRTGSGSEIDFIIEIRRRQRLSKAHIVCLEVKLAQNWDRSWERSMRSLSTHENINVARMVGIYTGKRNYQFDGIDVLPLKDFLERLYEGEFF